MNDIVVPATYDLDYEIARALEFAAVLAGRPIRCARQQDIVKAIAPAFAIDDLVLVGTLHMLSQIGIYTAALRSESPGQAGTPE